MPFKKLSRHTFLTTSSALAFLHTPFTRTPPTRQIVNVSGYNPHGQIASFEQAFSEEQTVVIPTGSVYESINTGIFIPPGKTLYILGSLRDNGRGRFVSQDGSQVTGEKGGRMHSITLDVHGSDHIIKGLAMSGFGPVTRTYVGGKSKCIMYNLTIDSLTVNHVNYAILRQGFHSRIIGANIISCKLSDLQGDTIEWNVAIGGRGILISDHAVERINCINSKINWGIGIRLAGSTYDSNCPENQAVKNFVAANITGPDCWQLVHVENGKHFVIRGIKARNITLDFSGKAGIDNATVTIYGCDSFVIDNIEMINSAGMLTGYGVIEGKYRSIPQNFRVSDIRLNSTHPVYKLCDI